jgi:uncharacterized protein (TIGR02217 family)
MTFYESPRFPDCIAAGSSGGPSWLTDVVQISSGHEQRNLRWADAMHRYDVSMGVRSISDMEKLIWFFHGARGRTHAFRFKDYSDYKSGSAAGDPTDQDQQIGLGDDSRTVFQLVKIYKLFGVQYDREITKPVAGTVSVALDAVSQPSGWTVDTTTGEITFTIPPTAGTIVTAGYEFDVPCRFEQDAISMSLQTPEIAGTDVTLVEIRL